MPHMANLSWIFMFLTFNMMLFTIMLSLKFLSINMHTNTTKQNNFKTMWQW